FQAEDGIRDLTVTGVQTCALPILAHTPRGTDILRYFVLDACQAPPTWTALQLIEEQVDLIREQVGSDQVICALSGGVDSAVATRSEERRVGKECRSRWRRYG